MEHVAILERHDDLTWYVHIPELQLGATIDEPGAAPSAAARLLAAADGRAPAEMQVAVHLVRRSDVLVATPCSPVAARHIDGVWHAGQRRGWVRQADESWRALVCYVVDGVQWERPLSAGQFAPLGGHGKPAQPLTAADARGAAHTTGVGP